MDDRRAKRRRKWIVFWLVVIGVPILAYLGFLIAYALVMSDFG